MISATRAPRVLLAHHTLPSIIRQARLQCLQSLQVGRLSASSTSSHALQWRSRVGPYYCGFVSMAGPYFPCDAVEPCTNDPTYKSYGIYDCNAVTTNICLDDSTAMTKCAVRIKACAASTARRSSYVRLGLLG